MCGQSQMMATWVKAARSCARVACAYARARACVPGHRCRTAPRWPEYMVLTEVSPKLMRSMRFPVAALRTPKYRHQRQAAEASGRRSRRAAKRVYRRKKASHAVPKMGPPGGRHSFFAQQSRSHFWDRQAAPQNGTAFWVQNAKKNRDARPGIGRGGLRPQRLDAQLVPDLEAPKPRLECPAPAEGPHPLSAGEHAIPWGDRLATDRRPMRLSGALAKGSRTWRHPLVNVCVCHPSGQAPLIVEFVCLGPGSMLRARRRSKVYALSARPKELIFHSATALVHRQRLALPRPCASAAAVHPGSCAGRRIPCRSVETEHGACFERREP